MLRAMHIPLDYSVLHRPHKGAGNLGEGKIETEYWTLSFDLGIDNFRSKRFPPLSY